MPLAKTRRLDLDRAKGLGILLVVLGHLVARSAPTDNGWYELLQSGVYQFHMPFFMYLSGYVTFLSGDERAPPARWGSLTAKRASRLLVPFVLFGLAILVGKLVAAQLLYVDNLPGSFADGLKRMVWNTDSSPAVSVWYIIVLFIFCIATPPLLRLFRDRTALLLAFAVVVYALPVPHVMYLDRVARYYIFFVLGGLAAEAGGRWLSAMDRYHWAALAAFGGALLATLAGWIRLSPEASLLLCGMLSMPALHGMIRTPPFSTSKVLLTIGTFSFIIYLLNTICIGLLKGVMLKLMSWDGPNFLLFAPLLMLAGTVGPMLIKRYLLPHVPALDRITN